MGNEIINVQGVEIKIATVHEDDYISLTDMTKSFGDGDQLIKNWLENKNRIDFIGVWETLNNPNFNLVEFHQIKTEAGLNRFIMSAKKWIERTGGIGLIAKAGRYGGTYAHKDIAFEFGSWLSPEFKLYLIREFQRLKEQELGRNKLEWNIRRTLVKAQYKVHTDAVKNNLIPQEITKSQEGLIYASEADILNQALFGCTAKQWREENPGKAGNIRDYASIEQLVVMTSLESQNALLIEQGVTARDRLVILNDLARRQMQSLIDTSSIRKLGGSPDLLTSQ